MPTHADRPGPVRGRPSRRCLVLAGFLLALLHAAPLPAQGTLLGIGSDHTAGSRPTTGSTATALPGPVAPVPGGTIDPGLPAASYTWARSDRVLAKARHFDPEADSPAYHNFGFQRPFAGGSSGTCWGYNLLMVTWFKALVVPVLSSGAPLGDVTLVNRLKVSGPIARENLERYRLRRYSPDHRAELTRAAAKLQSMQSTPHCPRELMTSTQMLVDRAIREVGDPALELTMLDVQTSSWGHSLIIYQVDEGFARPDRSGPEAHAIRLSLFDPNRPDSRGFLLVFPESDRTSFSADYQDWYKDNPSNTDPKVREPLQVGTYFAGNLRVSRVHAPDSVAEREELDRASPDLDRTTWISLEGGEPPPRPTPPPLPGLPPMGPLPNGVPPPPPPAAGAVPGFAL